MSKDICVLCTCSQRMCTSGPHSQRFVNIQRVVHIQHIVHIRAHTQVGDEVDLQQLGLQHSLLGAHVYIHTTHTHTHPPHTHLWVGDEIDLQQLGLQHGVLGQIGCQGIQQEGSGLTDHVALQEQLSCSVEVQLGGDLQEQNQGLGIRLGLGLHIQYTDTQRTNKCFCKPR